MRGRWRLLIPWWVVNYLRGGGEGTTYLSRAGDGGYLGTGQGREGRDDEGACEEHGCWGW